MNPEDALLRTLRALGQDPYEDDPIEAERSRHRAPTLFVVARDQLGKRPSAVDDCVRLAIENRVERDDFADQFSGWLELCRQRYELYRRAAMAKESGVPMPSAEQCARWTERITAKVMRCCPIAEDPDDAGYNPDWHPWPGEHVREHLEHQKITHSDLATMLSVQPTVLAHLLDGLLAIDEEMARNLSRALGGPEAGYWLRLQEHYDYWCATNGRPIAPKPIATGAG